ncbi:MAG: glycosyltransferase family 39 protein [Planctomycetaceae bacterium]
MSVPPIVSRPWFGPAAIAVTAWIAIVAAIDPAGSYPSLLQGPGLTVDESFNVQQGVYLAECVRHYGLGLLDLESIREVFDGKLYLADHPPLGRLWLGWHHQAAWSLAPPAEPDGIIVTACARTGSATALALTILLIGWFTGKTFGPLAGLLAAAILPLMPRIWGHAHLASLETITNLTCTAAVLAMAHGWNQSTPPTVRASLLAGAWLGLAFLTKIQAIFLPLSMIVWAIWRWRTNSWKPLLLWGLAAGAVFFLGWPWLWLDPIGHGYAYFARTTARATLSVWYFGMKYSDREVPWHYPWVMFAATIPLTTLFAGGFSLFRWSTKIAHSPQERSARLLLLGNIVLPLVAFSLPGVAVYDSERLFLTVFPFWAILAAHGVTQLLDVIPSGWKRNIAVGMLAIVLLFQGATLIALAPCSLDDYSRLVGQAQGAEHLGLETCYWGDAVTRDLLEDAVAHVPEGGELLVSPVLHLFQLEDLRQQSPILRRHQVMLAPYQGTPRPGQFLLIFRRRADLPDELRFGPHNAELMAEVRRQSTQLAGLYRFLPDSPP